MKTRNIIKHADYNCQCVGLDNGHYYLMKDGRRVALDYEVELRHSRGLTAWLNRNCEGWYTSRCNYPWYTARTPHNLYAFELERDADIARRVHSPAGCCCEEASLEPETNTESDAYLFGHADAQHGCGYQGHKYQQDATSWQNYTEGYNVGLNEAVPAVEHG